MNKVKINIVDPKGFQRGVNTFGDSLVPKKWV